MVHIRRRLALFLRSLDGQEWQENTALRWTGQMAVGALPGLAICLLVMRMSTVVSSPDGNLHQASIVPLLSAGALADTAAFHRMEYENIPSAQPAPAFRLPEPAPIAVEKITGKQDAPAIDFNAPRTAWNHLSQKTRSEIDTAIALHPHARHMVVHGSRLGHANARLLERYHATVQGLRGSSAYHFVIVNDGSIETCAAWKDGRTPASLVGTASDGTCVSVCVGGHFSTEPPSNAQMEALDELADYLSLKLGQITIEPHQGGDCLGKHFPADLLKSRK